MVFISAGRFTLAIFALLLSVVAPLGANTPLKIGSIVAGMVAGADSIDDLHHGGMTELFPGVRAPLPLGSFLHAFS